LKELRAFRFLNQLGQHSLQVFTFSLLITRIEAHAITTLPLAAKLALTLLTVASLIVPARVHQIYRDRKSRRVQVAAVPLGDASAA
jgi:hypothetical protein